MNHFKENFADIKKYTIEMCMFFLACSIAASDGPGNVSEKARKIRQIQLTEQPSFNTQNLDTKIESSNNSLTQTITPQVISVKNNQSINQPKTISGISSEQQIDQKAVSAGNIAQKARRFWNDNKLAEKAATITAAQKKSLEQVQQKKADSPFVSQPPIVVSAPAQAIQVSPSMTKPTEKITQDAVLPSNTMPAEKITQELVSPVISSSTNTPTSTASIIQASSKVAVPPPSGGSGTLDSETVQMLQQFFAVFPDPSQPQYALLPSLDAAVTLVYEKTLALPDSLLQAIRKLYSYFQSRVFDEKLSSQQAAVDSLQQKVNVAQSKDDPQLATYTSQLQQAKDAYASTKRALDSSIITLCMKSELWQKYQESLVVASYEYEQFLINQIHDDELEAFNFIPHYETAYYTDAFTQLRINAEIVRVFLVITELIRSRAFAQVTEWQSVKDYAELYDVIQIFKVTPTYLLQKAFTQATFATTKYPLVKESDILDPSGNITPGFKSFFTSAKNSNGSYSAFPNKNSQQMFSIDSTSREIFLTGMGNLFLTLTKEPSSGELSLVYTGTFNELFDQGAAGYVPTRAYMDLLGFSGVKLINQTLDYLFNTANLENTMAQLATLDPSYFTEMPLFFSYQPSDYLYLDDINFLKSGSVTLSPSPEGTAQAQGGGIGSIFERVGQAIAGAVCIVAAGALIAATPITFGLGAAGGVAIGGLGLGLIVDAASPNTPFHAIVQQTTSAVVAIGEDIKNEALSVAYAVRDIGKAIYYDTGIACAVEGISYSKAQSKAAAALADLNDQIGDFFDSIGDSIEQLGSIIKAGASAVGFSAGYVIGNILRDDKLGEDINGLITQLAATVVDFTAGSMAAGITTIGAGFQLSMAAIGILAQGLVAVLTAPFLLAAGGTPFSGMSNLGGNFLSTVVSAILRPIKFFGRNLMSSLSSFMQAVAYLAGAIIDLSIDIGGGMAALAAVTYGGDPKAAFNSVKSDVNAHRRVILASISGTILTIVGIITIVGSGGLALGIGIAFTVMGAGMMAMAAVGSNQQDEEAITDKANQVEFLQKFQAYLISSQATTAALQQLIVKDINMQEDDLLRNQERSLMYFQNYLNNSINTSVDISAYGIGSFYNQIMAPDPTTNISIADPGFVYGISTNRLALNPSQGMTFYNLQRNSFAQEVASMPKQIIKDAEANSTEINPSFTQLWINQKDLSMISNKENLAGEIRFRILNETQGAFYVGMFLSKQYIDQSSLSALFNNLSVLNASNDQNKYLYQQQAWNDIMDVNRHILNFNNKGRAFVIFREMLTAGPSLGLYEHQGAGWINKNIAPINYQTGVWYRMKAQINGASMQVKCWQENAQEPNWSTYQISPDEQFVYPKPIAIGDPLPQLQQTADFKIIADGGSHLYGYNSNSNNWSAYDPAESIKTKSAFSGSMGVITSGAAVEYQVITPAQSAIVSPVRAQSNEAINEQLKQAGLKTTVIDQAKSEGSIVVKPIEPETFGSLKLTPVNPDLLTKRAYIYTTNQTGLPNNGTDYVVFATSVKAGQGGDSDTAIGLGVSPATKPAPQAIVSLVTNKAYDSNMKVVGNCVGILTICQSSLNLSANLVKEISAVAAQYINSMIVTLTFENITLTLEKGAIQSGINIYSGNSITSEVKGKDYFVAASINAGGLITPSNAYGKKLDQTDSTINGLISLVSGTVFTYTVDGKGVFLSGQTLSKITIVPVPNAPQYTSLLSAYDKLLDSTLYQTIQAQVDAYTKAKAANISVQTTTMTQPKPSSTFTKPSGSLPSLSSATIGLPSFASLGTKNINNAWDTSGL